MPRDAELLAAILADPDDDAARAVHGDRLLGVGDARGELIAVQLGLAALERRGADDDPGWSVLKRRELTLLASHHGRWLGGLPPGGRGWLHRGFVAEVDVALDALLATPAVLTTEPVTRLSVAVDDPAATARLAGSGLARGVRALRLYGREGAARHVAALTRAATAGSGLPALVELGVFVGPQADDQTRTGAVRGLAASALAGKLRALNLGAWGTGRAALISALGADFPALERLAVAGEVRDADDASRLVAALRHGLPGLRRLALTDATIDDAAAKVLAAGLPPLEALVLSAEDLGPTGIAALVTAPALAGLRELGLEWYEHGTAVQGGVAELDALERLELTSAGVYLPTMVRARWPHLRSLTLTLDGRADLASLASATWPVLRELELRLWGEHADGLGAAVAAATALRGLTRLSLSRLDDDGAVRLARARWPALHTLVLPGATITDRGAAALISAASMPALVRLHVTAGGDSPEPGQITAAGWAALRARFGAGVVATLPSRDTWWPTVAVGHAGE